MLFGIVGAGGYWGPNWVRVLSQLDILSAVCEQDQSRLEQVKKKFGLEKSNIRFLDKYEEMLRMELDGVFVVTSPATHEKLAVQAMRSGKHVFIEKPLAETQEQCYRIKFEAERLNRIVMVGHTFIYHPAVRRFKALLNKIGKVRSIYTVRANFGLYQKSGVVHDLFPHDLSIFCYLCNGYPKSINADVNPFQDVAYISAEYNGVRCSAFLSWSYPDKTRRLIAVGEKGILEWDLSWPYLQLHHKWVQRNDDERFEHFDEGIERITIKDLSEPLMNESLHFMECIREKKEPFTGIDDGVNVVKGLELCEVKSI